MIATIWVAFSVWFLLWLMSSGEIEKKTIDLNNVQYTYSTYVFTAEVKLYIWWSIFYFLWITCFLLAASQYVLIVAVVSWYFT